MEYWHGQVGRKRQNALIMHISGGCMQTNAESTQRKSPSRSMRGSLPGTQSREIRSSIRTLGAGAAGSRRMTQGWISWGARSTRIISQNKRNVSPRIRRSCRYLYLREAELWHREANAGYLPGMYASRSCRQSRTARRSRPASRAGRAFRRRKSATSLTAKSQPAAWKRWSMPTSDQHPITPH